MYYRIVKCCFGAFLLSSFLVFSQEKPQPPVHNTYKVDLLLSEMEDGKRLNTRSYSMLIQSDDTGRIRQGNRVPINVGNIAPPSSSNMSAYAVTQIQYTDVGMNIDCRLNEREQRVLLNTTVEISSVAPEQGTSAALSNPVIRQARYQIPAIVQPGKQTVLTSVDEFDSKKRMQIEVLITKIQ
jgi:hypothetical protein